MDNLLEYPFLRSLIFSSQKLGIPRNMFIALVVVTLVVIIGLWQICFAADAVILSVVFKAIAQVDPYFSVMYLEVVKYPEVME